MDNIDFRILLLKLTYTVFGYIGVRQVDPPKVVQSFQVAQTSVRYVGS